MANEAPQTHRNMLDRLAAGDQAPQDAMGDLIESIWVPRYITFAGTALTLLPEHRGARILFTSAAGVAVATPDTLLTGFICSFVRLGAGLITFSNADLGGTTSGAQNTSCMIERLPTGEWFLSGTIA